MNDISTQTPLPISEAKAGRAQPESAGDPDLSQWLAAQVQGRLVLLAGVEDPDLPRMLAQTGSVVVGIDEIAGHVAAAEAALEGESEDIRGRVQFRPVAFDETVGVLPDAPERLFDTVVLGPEALRASDPRSAMACGMGRLRPGGHLLVWLPFGSQAAELAECLPGVLNGWGARLGAVQDLTLVGDLICLCVAQSADLGGVPEARILTLTENMLRRERLAQAAELERLTVQAEQRQTSDALPLSRAEARDRGWREALERLGSFEQTDDALARHCDHMARRSTDAEERLALTRLAQAVAPSPARAKALGLALLSAGHAQDARSQLAGLAADVALSSGERRLLEEVGTAKGAGPELRLAGCLDEETGRALAPDCDLLRLPETGWEDLLSAFGADLFLATGTETVPGGLLAWCRDHGLPTALWELDPTCAAEDLLRAAEGFDHLFLTEPGQVRAARRTLGKARVHLLLPACQPRQDNPLTHPARTDNVAVPSADRMAATLSQVLGDEDRLLVPYEPEAGLPEARFVVLPSRAEQDQSAGIDPLLPMCLATGRRVLGGYRHGHRLLFGDLVMSSDTPDELDRRFTQEVQPQADRLQLMALRKVLEQHTMRHRLARIARLTGAPEPDTGPSGLLVIAQAETAEEADLLLAHLRRQTQPGLRLTVMLAEAAQGAREALTAAGVRCLSATEAAVTPLSALSGGADWVGFFHPRDYYGPAYLRDLMLATGFAAGDAIGKTPAHAVEAGQIQQSDDMGAYASVAALPLRAALMRSSRVQGEMLATCCAAIADGDTGAAEAHALDPYGYCREGCAGGQPHPDVALRVDDPDGVLTGADLEALEVASDDEALEAPPAIVPVQLAGAALMSDFPVPTVPSVTWQADEEGRWYISSTLEVGTHRYFYQESCRPVEEVMQGGQMVFHLETSPGLHLLWVVLFFDASGARIGEAVLHANANSPADPPAGTCTVQFGIRVRGPGNATVQCLYLGNRPVYEAHWVATGARTLLLTNQYPSMQSLYSNAFVHRRVRGYRSRGKAVDVFCLQRDQDLRFWEFENVECALGAQPQLERVLNTRAHSHILVHFLDPEIWDSLRPHLDRVKVTVWVHGADIQPWWRRAHNYETDRDRALAKEASDTRVAFWQQVLGDMHPNLHVVFVSDYLAQQAMEDLEIALPEERYSVIHNPIDTELFAYHPKPAEQRLQVLSIRPYVSRTYANDLTVEAILRFRDHPAFTRFTFHLIGDGPLFDSTVAPLRDLPNVILEQRFLPQAEIARLHREAGVFLAPSRMDSQGVSRDEAMSSGLVPVTSRVGAIPDFVDETCGYLAPEEDAAALADALGALYADPAGFQTLSGAAAARVRQLSPADRVLDQECAFLA
jgi:glycosyltransferase involved in cell wall biosynthesis